MSTDIVRIELRTQATTYGTGPYHPAIRTGKDVMYWPNITFATEDEAYAWAAKSLYHAYDAADQVAREWNIYPV